MEEDKNMNEAAEASAMTNDELKQAITKQLEKVRNESIIIGYKVAAKTMMDIIAPWRKSGCSHREYERIFKKLEDFYGKALKQGENKSEESTTETVQN